jgi:hypothetical protein
VPFVLNPELTLNARAWGVLSGLALLAHFLFGPAEKRRDLRNRHSARERVNQKEQIGLLPRLADVVLCVVRQNRLPREPWGKIMTCRSMGFAISVLGIFFR